MNRTELVAATALVLFAAFALGWFASWLVFRFTRVSHAEVGELDRMAQALHEAEEVRDQALLWIDGRERELEAEAAAARADAEAALDGLRDSRHEVAELRAWIERNHGR